MPARLKLHILAKQAVEIVPERARAARQRQLDEIAALLAHAAEIDPARAGTAQPLFQHGNRQSGLAQRDRSPTGRDAAADDCDVDVEPLAHGSPPTGIGLIGGLPRSRPTAATSMATVRARTSAAAW